MRDVIMVKSSLAKLSSFGREKLKKFYVGENLGSSSLENLSHSPDSMMPAAAADITRIGVQEKIINQSFLLIFSGEIPMKSNIIYGNIILLIY